MLLFTKLTRQTVHIIILICIISVFQQGFLRAQSSEENLFSPENRLKFGNFLFCGKDYLRAVSEYRSYLQVQANDTVRFKIALALAEMGQFSESLDNYKGLFYNTSLGEEARLEFFKTSFISESGKSFRNLIDNNVYAPDSNSASLKKLYYASLFRENILPDSLDLLSNFSDDESVAIQNFYHRKKYPENRSENLAGILSAILPGLGKVYADETGDGITSFLFTGVLTFLAVNNFDHNHNFRGWVFTGLAAYFYAGNIYGSIAAAQNFNAAVKFKFDADFNFYLNSKNYFIPRHNIVCD